MTPPPRQRGLDPAADVPDGIGRALPRRGAGPARGRRRVLDRPLSGHQPPLRRLRGGDRLRHRRRAPARPGGVPGRAAGEPRAGLAGVHAHARAGGPAPHQPVVDMDAGRVLASPRGPGLGAGRARGAPGRPRRLRGRGRLRRVGRRRAADRGAVGARRARRARRRRLRLGRRAGAGRRPARQLLARRLPVAAGAGLRDDGAGRLLRAQRLRALRHGRQRLGVDGGLVRGQRGREPGPVAAAVRDPAQGASRAARSCAPTATACATAPPRGGRR